MHIEIVSGKCSHYNKLDAIEEIYSSARVKGERNNNNI